MTRARSMAWMRRALAGGAALAALAGAAWADPLAPEEREWLRANEPVVFVSQTTYPPFEFVDAEGRRQGMCIELARWIAAELGFRAEFRDMSFQQAQDAVLEGRADAITSLFHSPERERRFAFTGTTWEVPALIFVRAERPDVVTAGDLRGKRIAMQRGDYAGDYLARHGIEYEWVPTASFAEAAERVVAGAADALVGDEPIVLHHLFSRGLLGKMKSVGEPLYVGRNAMAARADRAMLASILDKGIAEARRQGALARIEAKWMGTRYGGEEPPRSAGDVLTLTAGLFAALAMVALLLSWVAYLRRLVAVRTMELTEARDPHLPVSRVRPFRLLAIRALLLLAILAPLGLLALRVLERNVVMPGHLALEAKEARRKMAAAADGLRRETRHLAKMAGDWAWWDSTYAFAGDLNSEYVESNLSWPNLSDQTQIDVVALYDPEGRQLLRRAWDPFRGESAELEFFARGALPPEHPLMRPPGPVQARRGILLTEAGPLLVASCEILPTNLDEPSRGTFVMGRFLREEMLADVAEQVGALVEVARRNDPALPNELRTRLERIEPGAFEIVPVDEGLLAGYAVLADVEGQPALMLAVSMPREVVAQGRAMARLLSTILLVFALVAFAGTSLWFALAFREAMRRQAHVEALVDARTKALRESEERFRIVFRQSPIPLTLARLSDGVFMDANEAFLEGTGYSADEIIGKTSPEVGLWAQPEQMRECLEAIRREGRVSAYPALVRSKNGELSHVLWSAEVVRMEGETYLVASSLDVTERRRAEEEREKLEAQLIQAQKMEAIGQLAGGVAHDFNNMLGVILGHAELAMEMVPPDGQLHDSLQEMYKAADRSAALTRQLLGFARKQTVVPRVLDVNETVDGMLKMIRRLIGENIELEWRPGANLGAVKVDPSQIDQILVNLCVNARDAIGGAGKISIETAETMFDEEFCARHPGAVMGRYVRLAVSDTGCGMDAETMAHVFEPFFTTKPVGQGAGLGMATVYGIVRQNNGFIDVRSEVGKGTAFTIYFPRHVPGVGSRDGRPGGAEARVGGETILLVEDEPSLLAMTRSLLERRGYNVLSAASPHAAIRMVRDNVLKIDLLISDVVMPEMNGQELARELIGEQPHLRRLFMSGHAASTLEESGILEEGVFFIQKPFAAADLARKVAEALGDGANGPAQETNQA